MAESRDIQTSFTSGELSPLLTGRVDIQAYRSGASELTNVCLLPFGGARRRRGTHYVASGKLADKSVRLIPFVYSQTDAYVLEFGDGYMRVYTDGARVGSPYEITTPYTEAQLFEIDYAQSADTMILVHRSHFPRRLRRFGDALWVMDQVPFDQLPCIERGARLPAAATLT